MFILSRKNISNKHTASRPVAKRLRNAFLAVLVGSSTLFGTEVFAQKKPLDHDVYDDWQSFGAKEISPNGKWSVYNVNPQEGDKWLYVQSTTKKTPQQKIHRGEKPSITTNSKHLVFAIKPFYKDIKAERVNKNKKGKDQIELAKDSLGVYDFSNNKLVKIPDVTSFKLPKENGEYLAYLQELNKEEADTTKSKKKETYKQLVVRNLSNHKEASFLHVDKYHFSEDGAYLVYSIKNTKKKEKKKDNGETENEGEEEVEVEEETTESGENSEDLPEGVYIVDTKTFKEVPVTDKKGDYSKLRFNEDSNLLAFIATHEQDKEEVKDYIVYFYNLSTNDLQTLDNDLNGIPEDWVLSENRSPQFSKNNKRLFLGIAPKQEAKDSTFIEEDHAILDVWHYKDDYLQPQQLARLKRDLERAYLSVVHLDNPSKLIPL